MASGSRSRAAARRGTSPRPRTARWTHARLLASALAAATSFAAAPARAQTVVAPGVTRYDAADWHAVVVELEDPEVTFEVSEPELRGSTVSEYAAARGAVVALNGGPFSLEGFTPAGLAVGGSRPWAGTADDGAHTLLAVDVDGCGGIYRAEPWVHRERWMTAAVSGTDIVTADGLGVEPGGCPGACAARAQSAVGLSADGRRMVLVAADAATPRETGDLLAAHGAWVGMLLDGGPSTALVVQGEVVNVLSDGVERRVATHLGIFSGRSPRAWDVRGIVPGQPTVDVQLRTFWDAPLDGRRTTPIGGGDGSDGLFQFMPVPFRNVRIATADRCRYTDFTGPEDVQLWWTVDEGATCPPVECTRVAEAWAVRTPTCDDRGAGADARVWGGGSMHALASALSLGALALALGVVLRRREP